MKKLIRVCSGCLALDNSQLLQWRRGLWLPLMEELENLTPIWRNTERLQQYFTANDVAEDKQRPYYLVDVE